MPCSADDLIGQVGGVSRDDRRRGGRGSSAGAVLSSSPHGPRRSSPGEPGFIGSHVARALAARGDELRLLIRRGARTEHLADLDYRARHRRRHRPPRRPPGDEGRRPRLPRRRARPRCASSDHDRVFAVNLGGTRNVLEEALRRRRRAGRPHVLGRRDRAGAGGQDGRRDPAVHRRRARHRLRQLQARGRGRGAALRGQGPRRGLRQPDLRARPRRPELGLDGPGPPVPAAPDPGLRRRRPQHRRRPRRRRRATPRRREGRVGGALHPRRPELHPAAPLRRPLPDLGRAAAGDAAARADGDRRRRGDAPARDPAAGHPRRDPLGRRSGGPTRSTKAKKELGFQPRPHEETLEDAVRWQLSRARRAGRARGEADGHPASSSPAASLQGGRADRAGR